MNRTALQAAYRAACDEVQRTADAIEAAAETDDMSALTEAFNEAELEAERCRANLDALDRAERARAEHPVLVEAGAPELRVVSEPEIYREDNQHERSFFGDMFARDFAGDQGARERLEQHYRAAADGIERRDVGTGAFSGLVIPQYLVDQYAPIARAGAPFVDNCVTKLQLPAEGMTVNISRVTTGSTAAAQATENAAASETDMDDTLLTVNVRTYAGQQDVSRQLLERGTPGMDGLIFADLLSDYFTKLGSAVLNGDGNNGTHLGVRSVVGIKAVTYDDASPTVSEIYPKIADAIQQINSSRFLPATHIAMHPRRWGWFTAALDSSGRPFVVPNAAGPYMAQGVNADVNYGGVVGTLQGLPVITDANLPTTLGGGTEDVILLCRKPDCLLWQEGDGAPRQARFEQTAGGNLTVKLVLYGYTAFTAGRYPAGHGTISGTGLIAPTF